MVLYNHKEQRKYLWDGAQVKTRYQDLGAPLWLPDWYRGRKRGGIGGGKVRDGKKNCDIVSYYSHFLFLCSSHTNLLLVPKCTMFLSFFFLYTCCLLYLQHFLIHPICLVNSSTTFTVHFDVISSRKHSLTPYTRSLYVLHAISNHQLLNILYIETGATGF